MIAVTAAFKIKEENVAAFIETAKELVEKTNSERGCASYQLVRDGNDPQAYMFMERWEDKPSLDAHMKTEHFTRIVPLLGKLMDGESKLRVYEVVL